MATTTRGDRYHLVTLANPGPPMPDGHGGYTADYVPLEPPTMYAAMRPAEARDLERGRLETSVSVATHVLTMDFHPQVSTQTRIEAPGGRVLHVTGVRSPDFRGVELEITCAEVVP